MVIRSPLAIFLAAIWTLEAGAQLPSREERFIRTLVNEYRVLDIAEHYCRERLKSAGDRLERASLEWILEADIPRARGDIKTFEKAILELAKKYPDHPRAGRSRLDFMKSQIDRLTGMWEDALVEADLNKRKELLQKVVDEFEKKVRPGFEELIKNLNASVKAAEEKGEIDEMGMLKDADLALLRNESEFFWILALHRYARFLNVEGFKKKREKVLGEALKLAGRFVEDRTEFYVLRYLAQIQRGLCLLELGRYAEAADAFEALFMAPVLTPRSAWDRQLIERICDIRLQAYVYAMRAYNQAGKYAMAVKRSERLFAGQPPPFNLVAEGPKVPSLRRWWVEAQLEAGVALAGVGRPVEGAKRIRSVIDKYRMKKGDREATAFVQKARSALARMVRVAGPIFDPATILEAGRGVKGDLDWVGARRIFEIGIGSLRTPEEVVEYAPEFLGEIAECSHLAGQLREALVASLTALRHFAEDIKEARLRERLANFALAAAEGLKAKENNAALDHFYNESVDLFRKYGRPDERLLQQLSSAVDLKSRNKFEEARKAFLAIEATFEHGGEMRPFRSYWRARAEAADCLYRIYLEEAKKGKADPKKRAQAEKELKEVLSESLKAKPLQLDGAAAAVYYLSEIYLEEGSEDLKAALSVLKLFDDKLDRKREKGALDAFQEYREGALKNYVIVLAKLDRKKEAYRRFLSLKKEFPAAVDWAIAAYELFFYYQVREEHCTAAAYGNAYLSHPAVANGPADEELLFTVALEMADCGKEPFLQRASDIFARFAEDPNRDRRIRALQGLIKIMLAKKQYAEALKRGKALLKEKKPGEEWVPRLYHDLKRALVGLAIQANKAGERSKALEYLLEAERHMRRLIALLQSAREDALNSREVGKYQELTIFYYRYFYELLQIWYAMHRYDRVVGYGESLLAKKPPFVPADLIRKIENIVKRAEGRLEGGRKRSGGKK